MRHHNTRQNLGFTLMEIMIVVLIIGILLAIAIPNFVQAREASRAKACIGNLKQIDSAKQQCAMDNNIDVTDTSTFSITDDGGTAATVSPWSLVDLSGKTGYLHTIPICPSEGTYTVGMLNTLPTCNIAINSTDPNYQKSSAGIAGVFYHGL